MNEDRIEHITKIFIIYGATLPITNDIPGWQRRADALANDRDRQCFEITQEERLSMRIN